MSPADASIACTLDATGNPTLLRSGCKADTSPPNGMLLVNRSFGSVRQREHTLNQHFDDRQLRRGGNPFTPVNTQTPHSARRVNALISKGLHPSGPVL